MNQGFFNTFQMRLLGGLFILMGMIALGSYASLNFEKIRHIDQYPATITVSGEGEVVAVPDVGRFTFSVNAEADGASEAQEMSGTKINEIIAYLAEEGVAEEDIKTEAYNLYPQWRYEERICAAGVSYCPPGERVQDGFSVTQTIAVKVRETDRAGEIIAGVGELGATNISGLSFTIDDPTALKAEARAEAIKDAQMEATKLAEQLGVRIVKMKNYYEEGGYYEPPHEHSVMAMDMAESEAGFGGAVMPTGEQSTTAQVNITYEVR